MARRNVDSAVSDESRRTHPLARSALGPRRFARLPGDARAVLDRHLPAGLHRHRRSDRRHAGRDATNALGLLVRVRRHEPVSRRAIRQLRAAPGRALGPGGVHACVGGLRDVAKHRATRVLSRRAGHVGRRGHRDLARSDSRYVPACRCAARDVASHDLLRRSACDRADGRRVSVRACRLAFDLLVSDRHRRDPVDCELQAAARNAAPEPAPAIQREEPDARLPRNGRQRALHDAGAGERHPVQRYVLVCALGAGFSRRSPAPSAGAVLLVVPDHDRRDHGRRVLLGAAGRAHQAAPPDSPRFF